MTRRARRACAAALACAATMGGACNDFGDPGRVEAPVPAVDFERDVQPIFSNHCAVSSCHAPPIQEGLDLRPGSAWDHIVGVPSRQNPNMQRVRPGAPDSSYLFLKLTDCGCYLGLRMPQFGPQLPDADRGRIRDWIAGGAPR